MSKRKAVSENTKRRLYAESMGRCMNPRCEAELFLNGDIAEKAHIIPHCDTADDSFENLILLCPNCHRDFDKNNTFDGSEVKIWKNIRREQISQIFTQQYDSFEKLENAVKPILEENKTIYENYYLKENLQLWTKFENKILTNNQQLKLILTRNKDLLQDFSNKEYSNLEIVNQLILHIDEFMGTRLDKEKSRTVLFPEKILSIFGIQAIKLNLFSSIESLECLINKLKPLEISIDIEDPYIKYIEKDAHIVLYLKDTPRLIQLYEQYRCFRKKELPLINLNFILKWLKNNNIAYSFCKLPSLSEIEIKGKSLKFIYKYCMSRADIISLCPKVGLNIVNLHNWNGEDCISSEAYAQAESMGVTLLTSNEFYKYVHKI